MSTIPLEEAQRRLPELLDAAANGEDSIISRGGGADVRLMPVAEPTVGARRGGGAHGWIVIEDGFDDPVSGFEPYT